MISQLNRTFVHEDNKGCYSIHTVNNGRILARHNERIMNCLNNYKFNILNGEIGYLNINFTGEYKSDLKIELVFQNSNEIKFIMPDQFDDLKLDLAYAITVHKSQGSEFNQVIIPLSRSHIFMWTRQLLYTAMSRAKEKILLIGDYSVFKSAIRNIKEEERLTNLFKKTIDINKLV